MGEIKYNKKYENKENFVSEGSDEDDDDDELEEEDYMDLNI
jgi:hypothetical protein